MSAENDEAPERLSGTVSLYNKYRPKRFSELVGQDDIAETIRVSIAKGGFPHAIMLSGPRGCGKTTTARIIASALNCPNGSNGEPCAECDICLAIQNGDFPGSVHELNAADNRGINDMRELIANINLAPQTKFKVYILDECHQLTAEASSLLLKYLEQPPLDNIVFILATTDIDKVLDTILSRTVVQTFRLLDKTSLTSLVKSVAKKEGMELSEEEVKLVVSNGRGSARDTLSQLQIYRMGGKLSDNSEASELIPRIIKAAVSRNLADALVAIAEAEKEKYLNARLVAEELLVFYRDALLYQTHPDLVMVYNDLDKILARAASENADHTLIRNMEIISECLSKMRTSGSARVALEGCIARIIVDPAGDQYSGLVEMIRRLQLNVTSLKNGFSDLASKIGVESTISDDIWAASADSKSVDNFPGEGTETPVRRRRRGDAPRRRKIAEEDAQEDEQTKSADPEPEEEERPRRRRRSDSAPRHRRRSEDIEGEQEDSEDESKMKTQEESENDQVEESSVEDDDEPEEASESDQDSAKQSTMEEDTARFAGKFEEAIETLSGRAKILVLEGDWGVRDGKFIIKTERRLPKTSQDKLLAKLGDDTIFEVNTEE